MSRSKRNVRWRLHGLDRLESRVCPSVSYVFDIVAQTDQAGLTSISQGASINDSGRVAFVGSTSAGQSVYTSDFAGGATIVSAGPTSNATFGTEIQINNAGMVAAVDNVTGPSPNPQRRARLWDSASPGTNVILARSSTPPIDGTFFDSIGNFTSVSNDGNLAFAGFFNLPAPTADIWKVNLTDSFVSAATPDGSNSNYVTSFGTTPIFRLMAADGNRVVIGSRDTAAGPKLIKLYDISIIDPDEQDIAETGATWTDLGLRPGISDDGTAVAFYGVLSPAGAVSLGLTPGPGVFVGYINASSQPVIVRVAGVAGNGVLDPGETFNDDNGNGTLDAAPEVDKQPLHTFSSFAVDTRVAVEFKGATRGALTVVFTAFDEAAREGIYSADVINLPSAVGGFTVTTASAVVRVGDTYPGLGQVTDVAMNDALNAKGQVTFWAQAGSIDAVVRANPVLTPVVIVPGVAGSFPTGSYRDWLMTRGIAPAALTIDPLTRVYADLVQTLRNAGYVLGQNLFLAVYDWRLPSAPADATAPDGQVSGITAASITDATYAYGVDYLGYWLKLAAETWESVHNRPLPSVDIIAHSMGGLVSRAYIQSPAYGATYATGRQLPKVDNLVMVATPNEGATQAYNPFLQDNWDASRSYRLFLSKWLANAYNKVLGGATVTGPQPITRATVVNPSTGNLDANSPKRFIAAYVPSLRDLLPTFNFLDPGSGTLGNINGTADKNALALDLNSGLNTPSAAGDRSAFAAGVRATVLYGTSESTAVRAVQRLGTGGEPRVIAPFDYFELPVFFRRRPLPGETWFEDQSDPASGDGTVPLRSLRSRFATDQRFRVYELTGGVVDHLGIVSKPTAQSLLLRTLGLHEDSTIPPVAISTTLSLWQGLSITGTAYSMYSDPVDAVLIDDQGRRVGYANGMALTEIPGSSYIGDADGFAFIPSTPAGLTLQLTGLGGPHLVAVDGGTDTTGLRTEGTLGVGQVQTFTIINLVAAVAAVTPNSGEAQRSRVTRLTVTFNTQVTFAGPVADAFLLARNGGGPVGGFTATAGVVGGVTVVTLSGFTGAETRFGSLADGFFRLTVRADQVSAGGQPLDGDGDGTPGGDYVLSGTAANGLFSLYGDANGDGVVNAFDFSQFRGAFGSSLGDTAYRDWLDFNGDGTINAFDFAQFRTRFGSGVP